MREWFSQGQSEIRLEWGISAVDYLAAEADCVIVVDVMSFSTCVSLAVDNGARIYPFPWKDRSALEYAATKGISTASSDRRFTGEGYSLSPKSLQHIRRGESLLLPSPNGSSVSFRARDAGSAVFSGCFRNMTATATACRHYDRILVIPCGEKWPDGSLRPAVEDYVAAGAIISATGRENCSPEAQAAVAAWTFHQKTDLSLLYECSSARELRMRGFAADVTLCLEPDVASSACQLYGDFYSTADMAGQSLQKK